MRISVVAGLCAGLAVSAVAQTASAVKPAEGKAWIAKSDAYTQQVLDVELRHSPELGSAEGLAQFDKQASRPTEADVQAERAELQAVAARLKAAEATEPDKRVKEDLEIVQKALDLRFREEAYHEAHQVPFLNANEMVFGDLKTLLDDQVAPERRPAALVRHMVPPPFLENTGQHGQFVLPADAYRVLEQDVVLSHAFAKEEVERFTYRSPGQANSYFYGYTRLLQLRKETEAALGPKFDALKFHDFLLAQGLLPPDLLRKAVLEDFIPNQR